MSAKSNFWKMKILKICLSNFYVPSQVIFIYAISLSITVVISLPLTFCVWLVANLEALNFQLRTWFVLCQNVEFWHKTVINYTRCCWTSLILLCH
jgi:hypothetical protein